MTTASVKPSRASTVAASAETSRWLRIKKRVAAAAHAEMKTWDGGCRDQDVEDVVMDALTNAMRNGGTDDAAIVAAAESDVRNSLRHGRRTRGREVACGNAETLERALHADTPFASGKRRARHRARNSCELARQLEIHERQHITWAIESGAIFRDPQHERRLYQHLFDDIARHCGHELSDPQRTALVDGLVKFRESEIAVRCEQCAPGSRWIICAHTIPAFEAGEQVGGTDLRDARGRTKPRTELRFKLGASERIFDGDVPYENHSSTYLVRDAAGRLVTRALRIAGVDPDIKHLRKRQEDRSLTRTIQSFLERWERGPDGELRERQGPPERLRAPGARRRRPNVTGGKSAPIGGAAGPRGGAGPRDGR